MRHSVTSNYTKVAMRQIKKLDIGQKTARHTRCAQKKKPMITGISLNRT